MNAEEKKNAKRLLQLMVSNTIKLRSLFDNAAQIKRQHTLAQGKVMGCLFSCKASEGLRLKDIAEELGVTPGAVSQIVDGLVKVDLVVRRQSEIDRRSVYIQLTEKGEHTRKNLDIQFTRVMGGLLDKISTSDLKVCIEVLQDMHDEIQRTKDKGEQK